MNTETERAMQALQALIEGKIGLRRVHREKTFPTILSALRTQQERENPKPLTLDELKERVGKPIWIAVEENEQGEPSCWAIVGSEWENQNGVELHSLIKDDGGAYEYYGKTWTAYDHEPKEAHDATKDRILNLAEHKDCGMCAPPMDAQVAIHELCRYFLGENWHIVYPCNSRQANTEIVYAIELAYKGHKDNRIPKHELKRRRNHEKT